MITLDLEKQGERITFFGSADSTAPRVELEVRMAPGASGPPPHRVSSPPGPEGEGCPR